MPEQDGQDKTEKATPKRREDEKEKGNVAKSQDLSSVAVLLAGIFGLQIFSVKLFKVITELIRETYSNLHTFTVTQQTLQEQTIDMLLFVLPAVVPVLIIIMIVGIVVNFAQVGVVFASKAMAPDFKRISPLKGLKNLFSLKSIVELFKGLVKMGIVGWVGYSIIRNHFGDYWTLASLTVYQIFNFIMSLMYEIALKGAMALIIIAILDYAYQRYEYEQRIKMTKQEIRDEAKQFENPETKGRIRSVQKQLSRKRMMSAIPEATVVVTNPTHIAIALKYDPQEKSDAPTVVAKGIRKTAQRIKEIAYANDVPVIENKPLARQLYDTTEVGMEIPIIFYQAIAEILAQVYQMNKLKKSAIPG